MEERGVSADHSSINRWSIRVLPLMETMDRIHKHRVGSNWHISDRRSESRRFVSNAKKPSQCHSSRFTFASFLPVEVCRLGNFHFPAPPCLESSDPYRKGFQPTCRSFRGSFFTSALIFPRRSNLCSGVLGVNFLGFRGRPQFSQSRSFFADCFPSFIVEFLGRPVSNTAPTDRRPTVRGSGRAHPCPERYSCRAAA